MKRDRIGAIDVGTNKICTIMGDVNDTGGLRILGVGIAPSYGLQRGLVVNVNEAKESIRESVRRAEQITGYRLESAYIGITGHHISSANKQGAITITHNDQLVRSKDLKRVLEVACNVELPNEQKTLHVIPRTYSVDGQEGIKNPVGMHGSRLDIETHIITAAITSVQNLTKCIRGINIEIEDLVMGPLASAEAVLTEDEKNNGVMMADIGGGTTDISVFKDNTIYYAAVLPVAGYQLTRDISIGMGLSFELAEEMKKKYGNVMLAHEDIDEADRTLTVDGHSISYRDLSEIIRIRVDEILRLIVLELPQTDYAKLVPAGLVLTGGQANLSGLAELGREVTRLKVRIGTPKNLYGITDVLCDPAYATSVGLLLWKMRNKGTQSWQGKGNLHHLINRIFQLFGK